MSTFGIIFVSVVGANMVLVLVSVPFFNFITKRWFMGRRKKVQKSLDKKHTI